MALETVRGLLGEMARGIVVIGRVLWTTSWVLRILIAAACLSWIAIGIGAALSGTATLFLPLLLWVIFTVLVLSFIGDVFGG